MTAFTAQCRKHAIPFAADTSWQLARLDGEEVRDLVEGAAYLFCNEYEATLTERKTGWTGGEIVEHVGVRVTTLGAAGARVDRLGEPPVIVGPVPGVVPQEPTGAGDAFRAGFLAAIAWGLPLERAAQLGNMMAVHALETVGTQEYELTPGPAGRAAHRRLRPAGRCGSRRALPLNRDGVRPPQPAAGVAASDRAAGAEAARAQVATERAGRAR